MPFDHALFDSLESKLKEFHLESSKYGSFLADLYDLAETSNDYLEKIGDLLVLETQDADRTLKFLVRLQTILEHFEFHVKSSLPIIEDIIRELDVKGE